MKTILKSVSIILFGLIFSGGIVAAQEQTQSDMTKPANQTLKPVLTEEQRAMLKNDLQKRKEIREAFRATLSQEQKDMLTDPRMMKADRIKAFRASLTDNQVRMIKQRQQETKAARIQFRATLSDQQKLQFQRMAVNRARMNKAFFIRARLRHRLFGI
jgi:hypothetical protein